ncbi:hypothetical protein EVG20_g6694 [Dentipellis fragilis]|uniref:Uncharacterized protein n=1 Tax=Dentipellis fragilis TaxID=205917 RepID=A0A4Y9YLJ7_9AGAM|nr:hypothetical protein EVG20_g6694 [Dentipellis fragilis]
MAPEAEGVCSRLAINSNPSPDQAQGIPRRRDEDNKTRTNDRPGSCFVIPVRLMLFTQPLLALVLAIQLNHMTVACAANRPDHIASASAPVIIASSPRQGTKTAGRQDAGEVGICGLVS